MALTKAPEELLDKSLTSALTITTADNNAQLILANTDADANIAPLMQFYRNSSSPADNDQTGRIEFNARNDNSQDVNYATVVTQILDASDGTEDGRFAINTMVAGTSQSRIDIRASETVINNESLDLDFRVESDGNANMLFVDAGNNRVGVGLSAPSAVLHVDPEANVTTSFGSPLVKVGGDNSWGGNGSIYSIGFGYVESSVPSKSPAEIGFLTTDNQGYTEGALVFATRNVTTDTAPTERMRIDSAGRVTMPNQPAFNVYKSSSQTDIAINSAVTITWETEVFDIGSNFASNTFTAPVTGKYQFNANIRLLNLDAAANYMQVFLITSNRSYELFLIDPSGFSTDIDYFTFGGGTLVDMDANDTAYLSVTQSGGTAQLDIGNGTDAHFSGYLVA